MGEIPYVDFNTVSTPFYSYFMSIGLFLYDDGLIANEVWEHLHVELIDATNSSDTANEILQIFHRDANGSDIL